MTTPSRPIHGFIAELIGLREAAGQPSFGQMHKLSQTRGIPRELPPSTVSDVLNGKRERLPDWEFVASFVMVCHLHARHSGLLPEKTLGTLEHWNTRWLDARRGTHDPYATPADEAERRTSRMVALLTRRAGDREPGAAFRLAVIHLLLGDLAQARYWIHAATQQKDPEAEALARHPRQVEFAAQTAFGYGQAYEQEGAAKLDIARFYYKLAADRGHPRAAQRLRALRTVPFGKPLPAPVLP
jgi:hypothetical protein